MTTSYTNLQSARRAYLLLAVLAFLAPIAIGCNQSSSLPTDQDVPTVTKPSDLHKAEAVQASLGESIVASGADSIIGSDSADLSATESSNQPGGSLTEEVGSTDADADAVPSDILVAQNTTDEADAKDDFLQAPEPFKGWGKPDFAFVVTGRQHGYLEPCGCTGLENQKGGLARRHTMLKQLAAKGWKLVPLDIGNQVRRYGPQAELKLQQSAEALQKLGYQAVALGPDDFKMNSNTLLSLLVSGQDGAGLFLSGNVAVLDRDLTPASKVIEVAGKKIGITAVLGDKYTADLKSDELIRKAPADSLKKIVPELEKQNCDFLVLLSHASLEETEKLRVAYPQFDLIVTAGGPTEPPFVPEVDKASGAMTVQTGKKGMYACVVGVFNQGKKLRYQRLALDDSWEDSPDMLAQLRSYQKQLESMGLERLGIKPILHTSGREFVGSAKCGECHSKAFEIWEKTPHAHATDSIVSPPNDRGDIARHFDPECISCHVTGWNAQGFFPYKTGYLDLKASAHLTGNGCENCHGPGKDHVDAESGDIEADDAMLKKLRDGMKLTYGDAHDKCLECHDIDNSPDFHKEGAFKKFWDEVKHYGKE